MHCIRFTLVFAALLCSQFTSALDAPSGLIPPGLNPGDQFYIIFAGSDTVDGAQSSAVYASYAATVKANDPDTAAIAGWTTLFGHDDSSLVTQSAFSDTSQPIYNTNGDKVADNAAELFSTSLDSAIGYDESGVANSAYIWTGYNFTGGPTGIGDDSLGGNDSLTDGCLAGTADEDDNRWAASVLAGGAGCDGANLGLYVLSPLLTVPAPVVSIGAGSGLLDFGNHFRETASGEYALTLSNTGTADWEISSIEAPVAPFAATGGTCGSVPVTIAPGNSCTLTYTFTPGAIGAVSQTLSLISNAPSSPDSFTLQGAGVVTEAIPTMNRYALLVLALLIVAAVSSLGRRAV